MRPVILDKHFKLEVRPLLCLMGFHFKEGETLLTNLLDKVLTIAYDVVCTESITEAALCMTVVFIKSSTHVGPRMEVTAICLVDRFYLAAGDTPEISAWHSVTQSDIPRKYGIEPVNKR